MRFALIGVLIACNNASPVHVPRLGTIEISGVISSDAREPVAGAEVTLVGDETSLRAVTDRTGRYHFTIPPGGTWGLSAHHAPLVGAFLDARRLDEDTALDLALRAADGFAIRGVATGDFDKDTYVTIVETDLAHTGDAWTTAIKPDGTFAAIVPRYSRYLVQATGDHVIGTLTLDGERPSIDVTLEVTRPAPAPSEVSDWLGSRGARLTGTDPALPLDDLAALDKIVGDAKIIGLGEATHGTREYFQLKHRLVRYLVEKRGFTTFALEANVTECRALDAYIKGGPGDPRELLAATHFWVWNTEEVLALIEWLRGWNADPAHARVSFVGFDMQFVAAPMRSVAAYLAATVPDHATLVDPVRSLLSESAEELFESKPVEIAAGVTAIEARIAALSSVPVEVRDDLVVVRQWVDQQLEPNNWKMTRMRDRFMADNIATLAPRFDRLIVWAHNEHVERDYEFAMGAYLAAKFSSAYLPIGMVFDGGSFLASETGVTLDDESAAVTVGPAPANDLAAAFARTGAPLLLADLRTAPTYFQRPQLTRETGWSSATEAEMEGPTRVAKRFAAVIYVARSTPSHRL